MPILCQCTSCKRKLRVLDHLLGKMVRCPNCQTKFLAQGIAETVVSPQGGAEPRESPSADNPVSPPNVEDLMQTPVVPPVNPASATPAPALQMLEVNEPASTPPTPSPAGPPSAERIAPATPAVAAPAQLPPLEIPAVPAALQPFETPPLHVLAVLAAIVLGVSIISCGLGWWIGAAVENAAATAAAQPP
jgi:hypothetical protein